jgi:hypothetical protein
MMEQVPDPRFVLTQVNAESWAIHDLHYPDGDHRRVVCRIYEDTPVDVEVHWLRDLPLAPRYPSADDVLQSVRLFQNATRATRPIPISHRPPPPTRRRDFR